MVLGIHALPHHQIPIEDLKSLFVWLIEKGHQIFISQSLTKSVEKLGFSSNQFSIFNKMEDLSHLEMILSLGGDGTILDTILFAVPHNLPILGINFGRLGFLAGCNIYDYQDVIDRVSKGDFNFQEKALIDVQFKEESNLFSNMNFALNEISITKLDSASMITVGTNLNGAFLNDYWGDGLIISTPTGSTGYSLSCGGPILWPDSKGLIITPISGHNLSMRPLVLPESVVLELTPKGRQQKVMLSMDSRSKPFPSNQTIRVSVSQKVARFVRVEGYSFSQTLREKLFWGKDIRN